MSLTVVGDTLFFFADDGVHGFELWASAGPTAGARLVKDIRPGSEWSLLVQHPFQYPSLIAVGDTLFFSAADGVHGAELWALRLPAQPPRLYLPVIRH